MNFCQKCGERRWKKFIAYFLQFFAANAVNRGELFIFTAFSILLKKKALLDKWLKLLTSWMFPTPFSTAPTLMYFYHISCKFKKKLAMNAVNFCQKCVENGWKKFNAYFLHLFAANAVNRGELFIFTAFSVLFKKKTLLDKWLGPLTSWMFSTPYSTAPTLIYFHQISCNLIKR